jgi:hypothetical protein
MNPEDRAFLQKLVSQFPKLESVRDMVQILEGDHQGEITGVKVKATVVMDVAAADTAMKRETVARLSAENVSQILDGFQASTLVKDTQEYQAGVAAPGKKTTGSFIS